MIESEQNCECDAPLPTERMEGRDTSYPQLCDTCWWKQKAEKLEADQVYLLQDLRGIVGDLSGSWGDQQLKDHIQELVNFREQNSGDKKSNGT